MKKAVIINMILLFMVLNVKAIKVKFTVANMSVNVAEGSTGIFTAFQLRPNSYINPDTSTGAVAFTAAKVKDINDVNDPTRSTPDIWNGLQNDIVFLIYGGIKLVTEEELLHLRIGILVELGEQFLAGHWRLLTPNMQKQ